MLLIIKKVVGMKYNKILKLIRLMEDGGGNSTTIKEQLKCEIEKQKMSLKQRNLYLNLV